MKSDFELYVIQKVKERREQLNISQQDLAFRLDMSVGFVGKVESPRQPSKWKLEHLNALAKVLKCSPRDFLPIEPIE
jgi:transcriptional regulator with XRE-family HTH domain